MSSKSDSDTYICIYRKIQYHWLWEDKPFSNGQAWIDLLLIARRFDGPFTDAKHRLIQGKTGCVYRSFKDLAYRWGWDRKRVSSFLDALEREKMIEINKKQGSDRTTLRIVNYSDYQIERTSHRTSKRTTSEQLKDNSGTSEGHIKESSKKSPEGKKRKSASPVSSVEDPAAAPDDESDVVDFGAMTDEEYERWVKEWHESRNI